MLFRSEVINPDGKWASVIVRTRDMGTKRAGEFKDWIEEISIRHLGADFEVQVVGQWRSEERRVGKECRSRWSPYH